MPLHGFVRWIRRGESPWGTWPQRRRARPVALLVWLAFIVFPVANAIANREPAGAHARAIAASVVFVAAYAWLVTMLFRPGRGRLRLALIGVILGISVALTVVDQPGWAFLFSYASACVAVVFPSRLRFMAVVVCTAAAVGCALGAGGSGGLALGDGASAIGVGLLMVLMSDLRERNQELCEARAELADVAVARERERFARDLHDLLGHSLSVIAIKAELAGRMLPDRPERAAVEVADVEQVARQALGEVRQAVSGYRQPTLDGELEGARVALSAAGIDASFERPDGALEPEIEAVLAWAVREGATNVIRHSGASHCRVRIGARSDGGAVVEVVDDGGGGPVVDVTGNGHAVNGHAGNGIAGLAERAGRLNGRLEAGRAGDGSGFRLAVSLPPAVEAA
ncbi:MAG: sensor histidine kinase [Solirubrobacteraceae bacterium]